MRKKERPIKWRTWEGIPGCRGESGVYYDESYSEEERTALEYSYREFDRRMRWNQILFVITMIVIFVIGVLPAIALILLRLKLI